jgi:aldehyde:ferredoxin oxidoreductase
LLRKVTGWPCSGEELRHTGVRIHTLKKLFNIREGWQTGDDWLPPRLLAETLSTGVGRGTSLTPVELGEMIQSYYRARKWDNKGFVPNETLRELGLAELGSSNRSVRSNRQEQGA